MDSLPSDLIYEIASHLDGKSLINFCQTNQRSSRLTHNIRFWQLKLTSEFPFIDQTHVLNVRKAYIDHSCSNIKKIPIERFGKIIDDISVHRKSSFEKIIDGLVINDDYYLTVFDRLKQREIHTPAVQWTQMISFNARGDSTFRGPKNRYKTYTISSDINNPRLTRDQVYDTWWNSPDPKIILAYSSDYTPSYTLELRTGFETSPYVRTIFSSVFSIIVFFILFFLFLILLFIFPDLIRIVDLVFTSFRG